MEGLAEGSRQRESADKQYAGAGLDGGGISGKTFGEMAPAVPSATQIKLAAPNMAACRLIP